MLDLSLTLTSTPICATAAVCRICRIGAGSVEVAVTGVDALLLLTEWQHYTVLNWMALAGPVHSPAWLFDASSVTDLNKSEQRLTRVSRTRVDVANCFGRRGGIHQQ